ncbi:23 kDa jasmonate-induced protein-like [Primulina eburnea]|uniref:23 kDa jasmonate-induced protein-like n=1 Tax=Primulina eburnea TaxID=1245227 RepID=UPI003C6C93D6
MATNVFGNPVTDDTVRLLHPNIINITARDRAEVALQYMNADERATNVSRFVHNLKAAYGTGTSTLCMIFNATGGNLAFVLNHNWEGNVWQSPYPQIIQNGQWAGYLHVRGRLIGPSKAAIVYRGQDNDGAGRDWMLAWNTARMNYQNRVYAEIRAAGGFGSANWNTIDSSMERQTNNYSTTTLGGFASASIGSGSSPEFVGIMSLADLGPNFMAMASDVSVVSQSLDSKYVDDVDEAAAE